MDQSYSRASILEEIRPYQDHEVEAATKALTENPEFVMVLKMATPEYADAFMTAIRAARTIKDFKLNFSYKLIKGIVEKNSFSCSISGRSRLGADVPYTFISNHRDIVLDSALLNILLSDIGYRLPRIAIGDNLLVRPWVKDLVRLNDSVIVQRSLPPRQFLASAQTLSQYIRYSIQEDDSSMWIAQREGRAKDSDDRTQIALLKMIALSGTGDVIHRLKGINIAPVSISYEYDPCDYLKARELYTRKRNPEYRKPTGEDVLNMKEGIMGYKGRIHFALGTPLNQLLEREELPKAHNEQLQFVASVIDKEIHKLYRLYPGNYIAEDLLSGVDTYGKAGHYSPAEREQFLTYLTQQVVKTGLPQEAHEELRSLVLLMYANPLRNHLKANELKG
ncbi:1-acyl-sn-glycerol-3-phosphate acyltransferase [Porphyromonas circumdentaria]|uniref:1-acyl-sn-glycerol-3-phosphate acyltransferase n=1 Tax=Porphyromonas circumdentaria TaxID=29524 RepID=A0A1T4Q7C3_9PORP|nr:1-acyl-sn-glycerol-3-phosphate acyltransferase [Porphyromonas circumdentaria]MBB6276495.1 hypothetical protein [Porphyromonas circumdentaria]SJZ99487.1 1-acyl-sn-glycerol-3-phosphate acyltransferase [Porphyromonas circumdentaria]